MIFEEFEATNTTEADDQLNAPDTDAGDRPPVEPPKKPPTPVDVSCPKKRVAHENATRHTNSLPSFKQSQNHVQNAMQVSLELHFTPVFVLLSCRTVSLTPSSVANACLSPVQMWPRSQSICASKSCESNRKRPPPKCGSPPRRPNAGHSSDCSSRRNDAGSKRRTPT